MAAGKSESSFCRSRAERSLPHHRRGSACIRSPPGSLIGEFFYRQTIGLFEPAVLVEYLVFDFGGRSGAIDAAKTNLLISDLAFNDTHRKIIFQVASAYYRLLNAKGQREAAEVSLKNAEAVEEDAQSRLNNDLATKPDVLEATAARAQSDYELQAAIGAEDIAWGNLATAIGLSPDTRFQIQGIKDLATRPSVRTTSRITGAVGPCPRGQSSHPAGTGTYFTALSMSGDGGIVRAYGQQDLFPGHYVQGEFWTVNLQLKWTLFDGAPRI